MRAPSFLDILTEKIREDLRSEIRAEVEAQFGHTARTAPSSTNPANNLEAWLLTRAEKSTFSRAGAAKKAYTAAPKTQATPPPPPPKRERTACATTTEETFAFEFLVRYADDKDVDPNAFTESDLKSLWRQAALNTHPDRHTHADGTTQLRMSEVFAEITEAYNGLRTLFKD